MLHALVTASRVIQAASLLNGEAGVPPLSEPPTKLSLASCEETKLSRADRQPMTSGPPDIASTGRMQAITMWHVSIAVSQ